MSGPLVKNHSKPQNGKAILCSTENCVPIVVPGLATGSARAQVRVPHRYRRTRLMTPRQVQQPNASDDTSVPASGNRLRNVPEWKEEFTENLEDKEVPASWDTPASTSQDSVSERPQKSGIEKSTVFILTSRKTEIAKSARDQRLQGLLAGSALAMQYLGQKTIVAVITADHEVLHERGESRNNHRYAVVVQDLATHWIQSYPCRTKTSQETERSLRKFLDPSEKPKVIYTDNSLECGKSCEDLSWNHRTSTLDPRQMALLKDRYAE